MVWDALAFPLRRVESLCTLALYANGCTLSLLLPSIIIDIWSHKFFLYLSCVVVVALFPRIENRLCYAVTKRCKKMRDCDDRCNNYHIEMNRIRMFVSNVVEIDIIDCVKWIVLL